MTTTNYPNGQVLTSSALTQQAINVLLQTLTCGMLGINPVDDAQVRVDWQPEGQPDVSTPADDMCYLSCVTENVDYHTVRDRTFSGTTSVTENWGYTRGWRISWDLYGPNCVDRARQVNSALFMDYFNDQLSLSSLYPVLDPPEPVRIPVLHNAQWYEHTHFYCIFYEYVTETIQDGAVTSVEQKVYDGSPNDPIADFTVTNT